MVASKVPLYSNLCQAIILEVPSNPSKEMLFQSVSEVNESGVNTVVEQPGLYKVFSDVRFEGPPIESGKPYSSSTCQVKAYITLFHCGHYFPKYNVNMGYKSDCVLCIVICIAIIHSLQPPSL